MRRLSHLLRHQVNVRSCPGKGSAFTIEVPLPSNGSQFKHEGGSPEPDDEGAVLAQQTGTILVVEDDSDVRDLLEAFLKDDGHRTVSAADGIAALEIVANGKLKPDLILADNLPNGMDGVQVTAKLRETLDRQVPIIMLTGDISTTTLRDIALQDCVQLNKPVKLRQLTQVIQRLLPTAHIAPPGLPARTVKTIGRPEPPVIFVVDDDAGVRGSIRGVLEENGRTVEDYASCEAFLKAYQPGRDACLVIDAYLPGMTGLELLRRLHDAGHRLPAIMITGSSDVPMAVQAMKAGAADFIAKPIGAPELLASVDRAIEQSQDSTKLSAWRQHAADHVAGLSLRQRQIMDLVLAGHPSKNIAADLGISQRTVENHRATIMKKTGMRLLPALARLALAAAGNDTGETPA